MPAALEQQYGTVQWASHTNSIYTRYILSMACVELDESLLLSSKLMVSDEVEKIESISALVIFVYVHN